MDGSAITISATQPAPICSFTNWPAWA